MALDPLLDIKDLEHGQCVADDDGYVAVRTSVVLDVEHSTTTSSMNVILTNANTQYSQALIDNTKQLRFRARTAVDIRYGWDAGKVATPIAPYFTLPAGLDYASDKILLTSKTIYLATSISGTIVELETMI